MSKNGITGSHSMHSIIGSRTYAKESREENDFYATEPKAGELLMELEPFSQNIWECACGQGHLSKAFEKCGHTVKSTDLIDRGYGVSGVDFLQCNEKFDGDIITNPPYRYTEEFIKKAIDLVTDGHKVAMFLKIQFLESKSRKSLFQQYPPPNNICFLITT